MPQNYGKDKFSNTSDSTEESDDEDVKSYPTDETTLADWVNAPKIGDLKKDFIAAKADSDAHVSEVTGWLDSLNVTGSAATKKVEGRSSVQPKVIRKQAEWRYAALSEPFLSSDDIFNVSPITFEDKKAAQQNELVLNNQFNTKLNKVNFIDNYVRTGVEEGDIIVQVGWEFEEGDVTTYEPIYEYQPNPNFEPNINELFAMQENLPKEFAKLPKHLQQAVELSVASGVPMEPVDTGEEKAITKKTTIKNNPTVEVCDYRNIIIDPTCLGDIDKAGFIIYSFETSLSELKKCGKYNNLDNIIIDAAGSVLADPDHSAGEINSFTYSDDPRKKMIAYEYWGFWDYNNTGIAEPFVATWVGQTLIRMEENPFPDKKLPFVKVQYLPRKRNSFGEPDGSLLEDNQKIVGAVTRGMIDILARSANGQMGMRKDALDTVNRRKFKRGENYEFNAHIDPRQAIQLHTYSEIPNSAINMINMQNAEAESLTGVIPFSTGISGTNLGDTATGVRGALDAASKRELGILRRLAKGITDIGRKFISMNAEFLEEEEVVRITNEEFVKVRRDDLAGKFDLRLTISTAEEDNGKAKELAFMLQTVGPSADPKMTYMIMADIARLRKMPDLAKRLEDYEPKPDPLQQRMQELGVAKLEAEIREIESRTVENTSQANLDAAKAVTEGVRAGNYQSDSDLKNLNFIEQESGVKQERDLERQGAQAQAQGKTKILEKVLQGTGTNPPA